MRFMGIDLGGTSIRAVVCTPDGTLISFGKAAGGNPRSSVGDPAANLAAAIQAGGVTDVDCVGVGAAGTGSARRQEMLETIEQGLRLAGVSAQHVCDTDFGIAYRSVAPSPNGRLLLAGTGAVAARFEDWRLAHRVDGMGWILGDTGSGSWIGREALRAVAAALDGRGPDSTLVDDVLNHYGLSREDVDVRQSLIRESDGTRAAQWAQLAPQVMTNEGDAVADRILDDAAKALLRAAAAAGTGDVVLAGGAMQTPALRRRIEAELGPCPHAEFPVVGACALAAAHMDAALDRARLAHELRNRDGA